jgi:hypothetical protein
MSELVKATRQEIDGFDTFSPEVAGADSEGGQGAPGSVIQGLMLKFTNEARWEFRDGEEVPPGLELIAVDVLRIAQKWINQEPIETVILAPGENPDVEGRNAASPKSEWGEDFNGNPKGPWQFQYIVYLLNPDTMDRFTFPTGTVGGGIAVRELADKVKWMRRFKGDKVCAVVELSDIFMNTRFGGRQRPHLAIKRWVALGAAALPPPAAEQTALPAAALQPKAESLPMETVAEPTLKEEMGGDEIPFVADSPNLVPAKSAAPSQTTKRDAQKTAGGR